MCAGPASLGTAGDLTVGVLLIGSLFWCDRAHRRAWRNERLKLRERKYVKVPIRYGRRSESRQDCFTMVFSTSLNEREFGCAIVVPCKSQDLIEEAVRLWTAETPRGENGKREISKKWGCVGLLENPNRRMPDSVRNDWITKVRAETTYGNLKSAAGEKNGGRYGWFPEHCMAEGC